MKTILLSVLFFCFIFVAQHSEAKVKIIGVDIQGLHQADGLGVYDQILNHILIKSDAATLNIFPPARAIKLFASCQNCCFSPANKNEEFYDFDENVFVTEPMNFAKLYIFVAFGQEPISKLSSLSGKIVGFRFGMPYGKTFEQSKLKKLPVYDLAEHMPLLKHKHIDAFVAFAPDIYKKFKELNMKSLPHNVDKPIAVHPDKLVCRGVKDSFIRQFNKKLAQLRKSGQLKVMLGDNYIPE
ncbi:type 2 periplasmic-binding domain-containing protein [Algicola sagamiensis]|uniref:transporter substrate-binding domain-containing protein n=1 Tax=Algicola sagamiensis TaxID=163869 RepID=UPI00036BD214|nr:transporter substrate-binding domain-containing protein [Algicola sagamiensis]